MKVYIEDRKSMYPAHCGHQTQKKILPILPIVGKKQRKNHFQTLLFLIFIGKIYHFSLSEISTRDPPKPIPSPFKALPEPPIVRENEKISKVLRLW